MKIATWNINSIRARMEHLLNWLRETNPDVVLLQETKVTDDQFPSEPIEDLGYNLAFHGQKSYNGVAILSKSPIEDITMGLSGNGDDDQARYIEAVINNVRVASIYVPNGQEVGSEKFLYKLKFLDHLYDHVKHLLTYEEAFVLGGDYNIAFTDQDVYDPERRRERILCSTPEREALRKTLYLGLTDGLRAMHPLGTPEGQELYTWWDYRAGSWQNNQGFRIDHLLLSPQAADRLQAANVDRDVRGQDKASDHAPVWCKVQ